MGGENSFFYDSSSLLLPMDDGGGTMLGRIMTGVAHSVYELGHEMVGGAPDNEFPKPPKSLHDPRGKRNKVSMYMR